MCEGCGQLRRIDPRNRNGHAHCSTCVGLEPLSTCRVCGIEDIIARDGCCHACLLVARVDALLGANTDLVPLRRVLLATDTPRSVMRWLAKPFVSKMLAAMAAGDVAISHATLDNVDPSAGDGFVAHLRAVLVSGGVLGERDERLVRLETFIEAQIAAVTPDDDRKIIGAFGRWHVLRRVRQRAPRACQGVCVRRVHHLS